MRQAATIALAALLALSVIGMPAAGAVASAEPTVMQESNETNSTVAPGERLSGVIGVQEAEIEGEVEERAFGIAVARAANDSQRADAVLAQINQSSERLAELRDQRRELEQARENGSMSEGQYRSRLAALAQRTENVKRLANQSENVSKSLPEDVLREKGVNVTAIQTLKSDAENLSGPEVAAVARSIAGGEDGQPEAYDAPNATEAIEHAEARVAAARERLNETRTLINDTNASENATEALAEAEAQLEQAEQALEEARAASEEGDTERARELADDAADAALESVDEAADARETSEDGDGAETETPEETETESPDSDDERDTSDSSDTSESDATTETERSR